MTCPHGEIRLDEDGALDEVVASDVAHVHLEQMDVGCWWLRLDLQDGGAIVVNLCTKRPGRTPIAGTAERETT